MKTFLGSCAGELGCIASKGPDVALASSVCTLHVGLQQMLSLKHCVPTEQNTSGSLALIDYR